MIRALRGTFLETVVLRIRSNNFKICFWNFPFLKLSEFDLQKDSLSAQKSNEISKLHTRCLEEVLIGCILLVWSCLPRSLSFKIFFRNFSRNSKETPQFGRKIFVTFLKTVLYVSLETSVWKKSSMKKNPSISIDRGI